MTPAPGAGSEGTKKKRRRKRPAHRSPQNNNSSNATTSTEVTTHNPAEKKDRPATPYAKRVDEVSAGGLVIDLSGSRGLLIGRIDQKDASRERLIWSLPKGHIDPGEEKLTAAIREIEEESGILRLTFIRELGSYSRYKIGVGGQKEDTSELKTIHMFLFTTDEVKLKPIDPNNPEARWAHEDDVESLLTHPKDKLFFRSIRPYLRK